MERKLYLGGLVLVWGVLHMWFKRSAKGAWLIYAHKANAIILIHIDI